MIKFLIILLFPVIAFSQSKYILDCDSSAFYDSMKRLESVMGKSEIPQNRGIADVFNRASGAALGSPWCMSLQFWAWNGLCPHPRTALANYPYGYARNKGYKSLYEANFGDYLIWYNPGKITGHIERIYMVHQGGFVATYAGNTSEVNVREGGKAAKMLRHTKRNLGRMKVRGLVGFNYKKGK